MKRALLSLVLLCISLPLYAALVDQSEIVALYDRERSGMRAYQAGDYESKCHCDQRTEGVTIPGGVDAFEGSGRW